MSPGLDGHNEESVEKCGVNSGSVAITDGCEHRLKFGGGSSMSGMGVDVLLDRLKLSSKRVKNGPRKNQNEA